MSSISAILIKCASAKSLSPSTAHKIHIQQTILGFFAPPNDCNGIDAVLHKDKYANLYSAQ